MLLDFYRFLTHRCAFLVRRHLLSRAKNGKEDPNRLKERYGQASYPRPAGDLIWIHAASVGESMSTLALIHKFLETPDPPRILLTTGTVTSARLMAAILPETVIHQYLPSDVPEWIERFLDHWKPTLVLWLESELWPNMIREIHARSLPFFLLNGRISDRTYKRWAWHKKSTAQLLKAFQTCFAQSKEDQDRLLKMGAVQVIMAGNLKFSATPLNADESELKRTKAMIGSRPLWLAASTHAGEESYIAQAHGLIRQTHPDALCILIPRHPERGGAIASALKGYCLARRSLGQAVTAQTQIYLADTMGELGLFYRIAPIAFIGGSLVPIGGHNLIEPAQLDCVPVHGPFMEKSLQTARVFQDGHASFAIQDPVSLAKAVKKVLDSPRLYCAMVKAGHRVIASQNQVLDAILQEILPRLHHADH